MKARNCQLARRKELENSNRLTADVNMHHFNPKFRICGCDFVDKKYNFKLNYK
jgi:hypothetical protein